MPDLPEIFLTRMKAMLGAEEFLAFCKAYENTPARGVRVNLLKFSGLRPEPHPLFEKSGAKTLTETAHSRGFKDEVFCRTFFQKSSWGFGGEAPENLRPVPWCKTGFYYDSSARPAKSIAYHAGLFYIQEPSAMLPAEMLGVAAGQKVLDICAAPGGKSVQIAGHLESGGLLVSNDASATRCRALVKNLERAGVTNATVLTEQPRRLAEKFPAFFDRILVDAPCSGEGMFRRDADAAKAYSANKPEACAAVQREILRYAAAMLKPGGRLVYSTCTFNRTENEDAAEAFLAAHGEFSLVETRRIWPHLAEGEGHFAALFEKNSLVDTSVNDTCVNEKSITPTPREFTAFCEENLCGDFFQKKFSQKKIFFHGATLFFREIPIELKGLRVARSGWLLGEVSKNRFVPSHALAMGIHKCDARFSAELSDDDAWKYLRGESLASDMLPTAKKPWVLVCHDGFPLGWARLVQGRLKNNLPVGWAIK